MSIIKERPRQTVRLHYTDPASTREYAVTECATRDEVSVLVKATAPLIDVVDDVPRFRESIEFKEFGGGCWEATVKYSKNPNSMDISFDLSAGSHKAQFSKETINAYSCANTYSGLPVDSTSQFPDYKKGIGFNGTHFDGVDIELPKMEIIINIKMRFTLLDPDYLDTLKEMSQTVNDAPFTFTWKGQNFSFDTGELRFRNPRLKQDSDDNLDITFNFLFSKNLTIADNFTVGASAPIEKLGHEYLWIAYQETNSANQIIKSPIAVYIERVYDYSDFALLGLGGGSNP